ncbi:Hyphally regulated cell wall protein 3, partial [Candida tropicalis]
VASEFTTTWTTTNSDGSVETESGIVSQSGSSVATVSTFSPEAENSYPDICKRGGDECLSGSSLSTLRPYFSNTTTPVPSTSTYASSEKHVSGTEVPDFIADVESIDVPKYSEDEFVTSSGTGVNTMFTSQNGEVATVTSDPTVGGSDNNIATSTFVNDGGEYPVTSIVTECIKGICFESTTTVLASGLADSSEEAKGSEASNGEQPSSTISGGNAAEISSIQSSDVYITTTSINSGFAGLTDTGSNSETSGHGDSNDGDAQYNGSGNSAENGADNGDSQSGGSNNGSAEGGSIVLSGLPNISGSTMTSSFTVPATSRVISSYTNQASSTFSPAIVLPAENGGIKYSTGGSLVFGLLLSAIISFF